MGRLPTVTWLALRELWITFRLVPIIGLPAASGLLIGVIPPEATELGPVATAGHWLAIGLAVVFSLIAAAAAATIAAERQRGTLGWLVVRAVPRSAVVVGWLVAFALPMVGGVGIGAIAAWLGALERLPTPPDALPFTVAAAAMLGVGLAALGAGLLIGSLLSPRPAFAVALLVCGVFGVLSAAGPFPDGLHPLTALAVLADLERGSTPVAAGVRGAGTALVAGAALLLLASAVTERRDL